jgi:hypothetical protein
LVLAGPLLRRTEPTSVAVWLATSRAGSVRVEVRRASGGPELGSKPAESHQLGKRLFVHLAKVTPQRDRFPCDELLAYDVQIEAAGELLSLSSLGLDRGPARLTYGDHPLPTFLIAEHAPVLNVMHGSCRLLHGGGDDALGIADETLEGCWDDLDRRPSALFLTGDQVYADEVAAPMLVHLRGLATALAGDPDETSVPGLPRLSALPLDARGQLVKDAAGFTSDKAHNHLASFGEFAAMYTMAWNPEVWPVMFPPAKGARASLAGVRRVLANTPTYMNFDDHDVTDDWNLTEAWRERVWRSPCGRRIVSNALAAFWAFQGWGNDPDSFDDAFKDTVTGYLRGADDVGDDDFDSTLWSFDRWSFTAPVRPPAVVLDTRTQRGYDSPEGGARLIGAKERARVAGLVRRAGHEPGRPLIVVSAVPVFGFELQERRQKYLVDRVGPYEIDFEAWHSSLRGLVDLMRLLVDELRPSFCLLLSGDVHYGVNARAGFSIGDRELAFSQLVSSGQKHAGPLARSALGILGHLLKVKHERLGWERPPRCTRTAALGRRIMFRAVNTDEWTESAPVFLAPTDARLLGIETPPDFREWRMYVRPRPGSGILVGDNNVGLVSVRDAEITHRLLTRRRAGIRARVATIDATSAPPEARASR